MSDNLGDRVEAVLDYARSVPRNRMWERRMRALCAQVFFLGMEIGWDRHAAAVEDLERERKPGGWLEWHQGRHAWMEHDGYRRHAHSLNGVLTIDPRDKNVHMSGGIPFDNKESP